MKSNPLPTVLLALGLTLQAASAQTPVTTDPVGFVNVTVPANSDATIAVPMNRAPEFKGVISAISGNTITVAGTPNWTANAFVQNLPGQTKTYAIQIASGTKEGMIGKVTANGTNTLTVQLDAGDDLTGVVAGASGDQIDVMPYWTPASIFSVVPPVGFEISGFEVGDVGVNFGASEIYSHVGANDWEDLINGGSVPHTPLRFGSALIARNSSSSAFTPAFVGSVPMSTFRIRLSTRAAGVAQEQYVGFLSPVPEKIASSTNPNSIGIPVVAGDTILGFNNAATGYNKGAEEIYQWTGFAWEDVINGVEVTPEVESLKPGFGYIFQKAATSSPVSVVWSKTPSYLQ
jgi:uncharacterized protein (TIGR02597 family)